MDIYKIAKEQHEILAKIQDLLETRFQNLSLPYPLSVELYQLLIKAKETSEHYQKWQNCEKIES